MYTASRIINSIIDRFFKVIKINDKNYNKNIVSSNNSTIKHNINSDINIIGTTDTISTIGTIGTIGTIDTIDNIDNIDNYVKCIDTNRKKLYFHYVLVVVLSLVYSIISSSISAFYNWIFFMTFFISLIYCVYTGVYLLKVVDRWDIQLNDGIVKLRDACIDISIKNYRLLREYREVYHYHYGDVLGQCIDRYKNGDIKSIDTTKNNIDESIDSISTINTVKNYVDFVLNNDPVEKLESYEWFRSSIEKINKYVKLCYYLSFLKSNDILNLNNNGVLHVNIASDSVLNKRNRKLENALNHIPIDYRHELVSAWNMIDKNMSYDVVVFLPCKWILYEYRNIFRYLYCAKYFKLIHKSFDKDYPEIEKSIKDICTSLQKIFSIDGRDCNYIPHYFRNLYDMLTDIMILLTDNFVALSLVNCVIMTSSFFSLPIFVSLAIITHTMVICILSSVQLMIKNVGCIIDNTENLENMDGRVESIFNEMNVILLDGKIKKVH